ncbi:two-component sensor histidine kinase [Halarcobacter mediterraneus]|uniref:histidine kinase n=1 Tax=Halarcobacter mediterraneus TaxID=2023153 RepID=A0A4Q1B3H7_9BACT|nr:ATP-binding protein [Halarcobacter mediterraneus]RXK12588.1 two-component sensor histidine kinase [Halarcobacter mediterraneus]
MLKIHQVFLRAFSVIFLLILIIISTTTYFWSKNVYLNQIEKNLSQNIDSLSLSLNSFDNIEYIIKTFKAKTGLRITIINEKGVVIADSDRDIKAMGNHSTRYEIIHAKYEGYGKKIRYSNTLKEELLYVAKKIVIDDEIYFLRLADYTAKIIENFSKLSFQIIGFISLFIIFAFIITYLISIKIRNETNAILGYLIELSNKKPTSNIYSDFSEEFYKITRLLNKVASKLAKREKQKSKQTAKLKLANKQKDEIISAISHEFKNPIAVITGYSETMIGDQDLPEAMKEKFLKKIQSNGIKMSRIIDKLRLSLKLEEGKQEILTTNCSIKELCKKVIYDLTDKYPKREIILKENEDFKINVDETLFLMALENLVENALKYSEDEVFIEYNENCIQIIDQGIGIEEKDLKRINQKFYRVSQNGWNNSLGLGLFIVNSIIKLHEFHLEVESVEEKGSKFIIKY